MAQNTNNTSSGCSKESCAGCPSAQSCPSAQGGQGAQDMHAPMNANSNVRHVIGIISGKGGVGKSSVTSMLAVWLRRQGYRVGILDADITGPSIPRMFGVDRLAGVKDEEMYPAETATGIRIVSINLLLEDEGQPVLWRGPILGGVLQQFWSEVRWGELDYLLVDMPPGTGDVALTVFQSLPVDGVFLVTSPQSLVEMIVTKAYNMAALMDIPVLGVIENFSWLTCPDCGRKIELFGESRIGEWALAHDVPVAAHLPLDPTMTAFSDNGKMEYYEVPEGFAAVAALLPKEEE